MVKNIRISPWLLLVLVAIIWRLVYAYYPVVHFHYVTPPGDDGAPHMNYIMMLINNGFKLSIGGYPMGFHYIIVILSKVLHQSPLNVLVWVTPGLMVIPIPAIYFAGRKIFNHPSVGALAALFWSFIALSPVRAYGDGNYPNMLASSFFLPLAVTYFYLLITKSKWRYLLLALLFSALIIFTHLLTLTYLVIAMIPWLISVLTGYIFSAKLHRKLWLIIGIITSVFILSGLAWIVIGPTAQPYIETLLHGKSLAIYFGNISEPISLQQMLELNNPLLIIAGLVGLLVLMFSRNNRPQKYLLAFWTLMLIWASSTSYFGLPGRFVRELAIPLSLAFGYGGYHFWLWAGKHKRGWMALAVIMLVISIDWVVSLSRPFALPQPFLFMQRVQNEQRAAYDWINAHASSDQKVLVNNHNPYVKYLINATVIAPVNIASVPSTLDGPGINYVLVGARPSQSQEEQYPYFIQFDAISIKMQKIPDLLLVQEFKQGTKIYQFGK